MSVNDSIFIDLQSLVPKKYFSSSGRSKHTPDIYNDPSRLFPNNQDPESSVNKTLAAYTKRYLNHLSQSAAESPGSGPDGYKSLVLPEIDKSSINTPKMKNPSPFKEVAKRYEESIQARIAERMSRPMRLVNGKKVIEKADDFLKSLRSPKDIFKENFQMMKKVDDQGNAQRFGKEDIRKIAKKYDVTINQQEEGEFRKKTHFMREVPMEYYQKLKQSIAAKSQKGTQRTSRTESKRPRGSELLDISMTSSQRRGPGMDYVPHISLKHSSMGSDSEANTPANPSQTTSQRSKIKTRRSGSTAFDIANREKSLFFSHLANTVELNRFSVSFNQGYQQPETPATPAAKILKTGSNENENEEGEEGEEAGTPKAIVKRMTRKQIQKEQQSWIVKTNDIKQGINDYLANKTIGASYIDFCQDKVEKDVKKLELVTEGNPIEEPEDEEKEDLNEILDKIDVDERFKEDISKKTKINKVTFMSKKNSEKNDAKSFYKFLILKEQRLAENTLAGMKNVKSKKSKGGAGRELFPRIGDA